MNLFRQIYDAGFLKIFGGIFSLTFIFLLADFFMGQGNVPPKSASLMIPFDHKLHGDSIGVDCTICHRGGRSAANAYMPSKTDCMDCHRLPLTENKGIEILDSALKKAPENPWSHKKYLPDHVVFHHGVHAAAQVSCNDCHGTGYQQNRYGGEIFKMQTCLQCHKGETFKNRNFKPAATDCAACHR